MSKVLVTGAATGIGRDTAIALAERGHDVIASAASLEDLNELQKHVKEHGLKMTFIKLDVLDEQDRKQAAKRKPDVLINNAGVGESGPLIEIPMERVRSNFETNVFANLHLAQLVGQRLIRKGEGRIIIVGSTAGRLVVPYMGAYHMTKFALEAVADNLRTELEQFGVFVSLIEPGKINTGFNQEMQATKHEWLTEESAYAFEIPKMKQAENTFWDGGYSTKSVVKAIVHAVEAKKPRTRYVAPRSNAPMIWLAQFLPDRFVDWATRKVVGL